MTHEASRRWDQETMLVVWLAAFVSLISLVYCFRHNELLLYGDAVAHMGIARRVFDSRTPGLLQLGTVWLPLPHLLMIPFVLSISMWQTGVGGSIPSAVAFVFGAVGIFRLVRDALSSGGDAGPAARLAAWGAALIYLANPNLLYLQSTAMTESLYLALFVWAVVYFAEFVREASGPSLVKCGYCVAAACLTRYDGWFLAAVMGVAGFAVVWRMKSRVPGIWPSFRTFAILAVSIPILWVAYNAMVYRNPLAFENGPYSAKAIERNTLTAGAPAHPGTHNLAMAAAYFLESAELNMTENPWHWLWLPLLVGATALILMRKRSLWPLLLLWTPLPFYMLSIAYAGVPIFLPVWFPHTIYNARYGLQLLPAFAVLIASAACLRTAFLRSSRTKLVAASMLAVFLAASYAGVWRKQPICFREAWINSRTRIALETELAKYLELMPPNTGILIYLGDHVGAMQRAGIPLRRAIYEGNHRVWKQPSDPDGLWERALANPAKYADYVIATAGDPVARQVNQRQLTALAVIHVLGQPQAVVYRTHPEAPARSQPSK
jgi:hypothetical protein